MSDQLSDGVSHFLRQNILAIILVGFGILFVISSFFFFLIPQTSQTANVPTITTVSPVEFVKPSPTSLPKVMVDIEGAVNHPGVYALAATSRVEEALSAAGGLSKNADQAKIATGLNLAAKLTDAMKIYIPAVGEAQAVVLGSSTDDDTQTSNGVVNINTASASDLDNLPGIGPVTAQKIIENRPYTAISDLEIKKIVKTNVYAEIKDKITVE